MMSDCSTHAFEYPGMSRLIIRWTDHNERAHDWPFVANGREVESVEVDGEVYIPSSKAMELARANGELEEIVRCRDCRAMRVKYGNVGIECWMSGEPFTVEPDGFCAWGERRTDDN